jgi:hypothetical protein
MMMMMMMHLFVREITAAAAAFNNAPNVINIHPLYCHYYCLLASYAVVLLLRIRIRIRICIRIRIRNDDTIQYNTYLSSFILGRIESNRI